jgi:tetratricopeptide (TPR) repeat protein
MLVLLPRGFAAAAYQLGDILGAEGDYEQSLRLLNQALKSNPYYAEAYFKRGEDSFRQKEYAEAEQCLKQAARLQPEDAPSAPYFSPLLSLCENPDL